MASSWVPRRPWLHRLDALEPAPQGRRYERERPGKLLHLDIQKLARFEQPGHRVTGNRRPCTSGAGWDSGHVCIDDHSRVDFAECCAHLGCVISRPGPIRPAPTERQNASFKPP